MVYKALIFDFNGLIVDDEPIHCQLFQKILAEEEIQLSDEDYWNSYLGFDDKGLIEAVFERAGKKLTPKKLRELVAKKNALYFPALQKGLRFFPGVIDFIKKVHVQYPLALVSGALRSEIDFVLKKGDIQSYFEVIVSADDTKHGKPDPEGFVLALAQLKKKHPEVRTDNCLVLEDSHVGIEAARRARMKVAALAHTYPREQLNEADFVADDFAQVSRLL